jgi:hypothetical protein
MRRIYFVEQLIMSHEPSNPNSSSISHALTLRGELKQTARGETCSIPYVLRKLGRELGVDTWWERAPQCCASI